MDIDSLAKGVGLFSSALAALKQIISLLPDNSKKEEALAYFEVDGNSKLPSPNQLPTLDMKFVASTFHQ